jgi:hypothetical protein
MKKFISLLLAAAIALLPFTTQAEAFRPASRAQLDAFKARCTLNVENGDTAALLTDFRRTYRVPADADVSVSISVDPPIIYPTPDVALGCLVLVVVISVVVWGVVIYIIYKICTKPPAGGGTNTNS